MNQGDTVDLIVVGFGGAGAAAAITAHDLGASVLLLEKAGEPGGSTQASGGNIRLVHDVDGAIRHFAQLAGSGVPEDVIAAYTRGLSDLPRWLTELGAELVPHDQFSEQALAAVRPGSFFTDVEGADALGSRVQVKRERGVTGGEAIWAVLEEGVRSRGIRAETGVRVEGLRWDERRERVVGVEVAGRPDLGGLSARGGVLLACGGFSWGTELQVDLFGTALPAFAPPGRNTGDGIRMAQEAGADLWHMTALAAKFGFKVPDEEAAYNCSPPSQGLFLVDQTGRRFLDEAGVDRHAAGRCLLDRDPVSGRQLRCPSWMVFDETTRLSGSLSVQTSGANRHRSWSEDSSREIERGWIHAADTIAELAGLLGVPAEALEATASRFNAACAAGDDELGRRPDLMEPVVTPPFYGVPVWPAVLNTQGGPRRNGRSEVLGVRGRPIPGLYSAGELGSMWGALYPGAGNLSEALVTGQIAARSAVEA